MYLCILKVKNIEESQNKINIQTRNLSLLCFIWFCNMLILIYIILFIFARIFTRIFFFTGTGNTHSHIHGPLSEIAKNTAPSHPKLHQLNHTPHACHKQANVEHIKRVSCNDC